MKRVSILFLFLLLFILSSCNGGKKVLEIQEGAQYECFNILTLDEYSSSPESYSLKVPDFEGDSILKIGDYLVYTFKSEKTFTLVKGEKVIAESQMYNVDNPLLVFCWWLVWILLICLIVFLIFTRLISN